MLESWLVYDIKIQKKKKPVLRRFSPELSKMKKNYAKLLSLPDELVIAILEYLPVKSVFRFMCVAKSWCSLFTDPMFMKNHRGSKQPMLLMSRCVPVPADQSKFNEEEEEEQGVLSFHDLDFPETEVRPSLSIMFLKDVLGSEIYEDAILGSEIYDIDDAVSWYVRDHSFSLLGSCNGIVCIRISEEFMLCNPALREFKRLPILNNHDLLDERSTGFGVASCGGNDFKVIVIHRDYDGRGQSDCLKAYLYCLRTDSWRQIDDISCFDFIVGGYVFLNSSCHWLGGKYHGSNWKIACFNMDSEIFRELEVFDSAMRPHIRTSTSIVVVNDCLGVVINAIDNISDGAELWVMKEYGVKESWTKMFVLDLPSAYSLSLLPWKNDVLMVDYRGAGMDRRVGSPDSLHCPAGQLSSISLGTNKKKNIEVYGAVNDRCMMIHEESLVSLNY